MLCQIFTGPQFQNFILKCCFLKWQCHEINRQKWFCWKIRFYGDIREISDSAQANNVRNQTQCRLTLRGVEFFELNIRISPRKLIFLQNHFSLLITQVGWIIEIKNCQQISWHKVVVYLPNILMVAEETASPYAFLAWQVYTPLSSGYTDSRSRAT